MAIIIPDEYDDDLDDFRIPFDPSLEHLELMDQVKLLVDKWTPRLPWLAGWKIALMPMPPEKGESAAFIQPYTYIRQATLGIRESLIETVLPKPERPYVHCLEEIVLHELIHILLLPFSQLVGTWAATEEGQPLPSLHENTNVSEPIVWQLCELIYQMDLGGLG